MADSFVAVTSRRNPCKSAGELGRTTAAAKRTAPLRVGARRLVVLVVVMKVV